MLVAPTFEAALVRIRGEYPNVFWGLNLDGHDRFSDFIIHPKFQFPKHLKYKIQFCGIFHFLTLLTPKTPTCEHKCHFLK